MALERTFSIVKPDATKRNLTGAICAMLEEGGLRIVAQKRIQLTLAQAQTFYAVHKERPFYKDLVAYIISGPIVAMCWEGPNAVAAARATIGATKPTEAGAGTIRGDFGMEIGRNLVHGSDSPENGIKETNIFFTADELVDWSRDVDRWIFE